MKKKLLLLPLLMLPLLAACNDDPVTPSSLAPISSEEPESSEAPSSKAPVVFEDLSFSALYDARVNSNLESLADKAVIMKGKIATLNTEYKQFTLQNGKVAIKVSYNRLSDFTPELNQNVEVKGQISSGVPTLDYYLNVDGSEGYSDVVGSIKVINEDFAIEDVNDITTAKQVWGYSHSKNVTFSVTLTSIGKPAGVARGKWLFTGKVNEDTKLISFVLNNSEQEVPEDRFHVGDSVSFSGQYVATESHVSLKDNQAYFVVSDLANLSGTK